MILADYPGNVAAAALLAGAALLVALAYRSEITRHIGLRRFLLGALQFAAVAVVLILIWNPSGPTGSRRESRNIVLAVFDTSESMSIIDGAEACRLDRAMGLFEKSFDPASPEAPVYRIYEFDANCRMTPALDSLKRWGPRSNMHAVMSVLDRYRRAAAPPPGEDDFDVSHVVGAVVFTDGQADDKNVSSYSSAANDDFPVVFIGVGSDEVPLDIAVMGIRAPSTVAIATSYDVEVDLTGRGKAEMPARIDLYEEGEIVGAADVRVTGDGTRMTVPFRLAARQLGTRRLQAVAATTGDEPNVSNNMRQTIVEVAHAPRIKALFYSQVASLDFGKVRASLSRDEKIELDVGLDAIISPALAEGARSVSGHIPLPKTKEGFYGYDVIILGPCDVAAFTPEQKAGLYSFVAERGGGLILLPGRDELDLGRIRDETLETLLPLEVPAPRPRGRGVLADLELTPEGLKAINLTTADFEDAPATANAFNKGTIKKPAASVLMTANREPLISVHRVGRGNVAFVNIYGLFRWYREDLDGGFLEKLLSSLTAYVAKVTSAEAKIDLYASRQPSDPLTVAFESRVWDDRWRPVEAATVLLNVSGTIVRMQEDTGGRYSAEITGVADESLLANVEAEKGGVFLGERLLVASLPLSKTEMDNVERDGDFLRSLADRIGGEYLNAEDIDAETSKVFPAKRVSHKGGFASAWRRWWLLSALCMLLSTLWFIRRAIGLI
ncbi:MAG: hypothetical protein ACYTAN_10425 [Planctomycetota bacterium]|jgi:hypothetical protein